MTAVERIQEYSTLPSEPLETGEIKPPSDWPTKGAIKFKNVSFGYAKKLPDVLHNLSFEIQPNEKIGIIGRTGAGLFKWNYINTQFNVDIFKWEKYDK